jgi:hypothetical protein
MEKFELTKEHIALLREMNVDWDYSSGGAPCIDSKRPYGNKDYLGDIANIIGEELFEDHCGAKHMTTEQYKKFEALHHETQKALRIVLAVGEFVPGTYTIDNDGMWKRL